MMTHRHKAITETEPHPMQGMCDCPGCAAAFAEVTETCFCGATRTRCCGMGRASDQKHRANGFYVWDAPADNETDDYDF